MSDITKAQRSLAIKAKHNKQHRFDHLYRLICREEWVQYALKAVLSKKGSRTAGIDGTTRKHLASQTARDKLTQELQRELRDGSFRPQPSKRIYIPKSNGKERPIGISTLKDRTVQMLLKMVLEPIYESDFLNCSNGYRPKRSTMDCIALLDSYINRRNKYYWAIEGDIKGAFDHINHKILLELVSQRVADRRILRLIERFLKAGVMEGELFIRTETGTAQGSVVSPLLANIYLHQLDLYWWEHYGGLGRKQKEKRRQKGQGNCALLRYADDFLLLTNGGKAEAHRLRDEFQGYIRETLKLELSLEKTRITHVNDGLDFLGFHIRRYTSGNDRPKLIIKPSKKAQQRLKQKVKAMTARRCFRDSPLLKVRALKAVLRGWINYYRHVNAKKTAKDLDWWVNQRFGRWLAARHRLPIRQILAKYKHREGNRFNLGVPTPNGIEFLFRMSDVPIKKRRSRKPPNPYIVGAVTGFSEKETPIAEYVWQGNADNQEWREIREEVLASYDRKCAECGKATRLDVHHIQAQRDGGVDEIENLVPLCRICHAKTPSFGGRKR
jgi:group II intron reverse transcriptase/maturase